MTREWLLAGIALLALLAGLAAALAWPVPCRAAPPAPYVSAAYAASRSDCSYQEVTRSP